MGTSDIVMERVQALLKVDNGSGSLYDHMVSLARKLADEKPAEALAQLETLSRHLKQSNFRGFSAPDEALPIVPDVPAEEFRLQLCSDLLKLVRPTSEPTVAPKVLGSVRNFVEDAAMFAWAGVGFGQQESYHIAMSLTKLASDTPSIEKLRLWGKILGTEGDYYIAEGLLESKTGTPPPVLPGTPEYDVEPRGEGANSFTYWVSPVGSAPWVRLPSARASHIVAARNIKHLMTGNLDAPVLSMPWYPGKERHLLRAQIARITASCTLAAKGWYELDEEVGENKIKQVEDAEANFCALEELVTEAGWVHSSPCLLKKGKCTFPNEEALADVLTEEQVAAIAEEKEAEGTIHAILETIEADLEDLKPEDSDGGSPAWSIRVFGDKGMYNFGDTPKSHQVTAVRSLIWPGAVAVAQGTKFANIYVGYGLKCGTLVPADPKSGLPLVNSSPFSPLVPDDICQEPPTWEEHDEPNPQEDEADSDKGSVDEEEAS